MFQKHHAILYKVCILLFFSPPFMLVLVAWWHLSRLSLVLTLMLILDVKEIQLTVHCTEEALRILSLDINGGATVFISVRPT